MSNDYDDLIAKIDKAHGEGTIMTLGDAKVDNVPHISTGSIEIDRASGIGGIAQGIIFEVYGENSSGKTTCMMQLAAQAQKNGINVAWVDVEQAFNPKYAEDLGLDRSRILFSQPAAAETAMDVIGKLVDSGQFGLVVLDSTGALAPKAELEGDFGDSHIGLVARLMSQSMRKLNGSCAANNCSLGLISQTRDNVNTMGFGSKKTVTGGTAIKFFCSQRLEIKNIGQIKQGDDRIGHKIRATFIKNRFAAPYQTVDTELIYGHGIDPYNEVINAGTKSAIISKAGAWLEYGDIKSQGKFKFRQELIDNDEVFQELKTLIVG